MNITCKAVKIHNFSARDFVTYFLTCAGGTAKSLPGESLISSCRRAPFCFIRKVCKCDSKPILTPGFILNVLMLVPLSNYRLTGLVLSSSVFGPLVNVRFSCKLYLL